jgi:ATP-dependent Clp protease ATP-binding subunit ClpA
MSANAPDDGWSPRMLEMEAALARDLPLEGGVISRIAKGIRKRMALMPDSKRPLGAFWLVGPDEKARTLASGLAHFLYGAEGATLTLDMQEYRDKHNMVRLIGHSGGMLSGYFEGTLTQPLWRNPKTVIVLQGVDKANHEVWAIFRDIRHQEILWDGWGRRVRLEQSVLLFTTMVGYQPNHAHRENPVVGDTELRSFPDEVKQVLETTIHPDLFWSVDDILLWN